MLHAHTVFGATVVVALVGTVAVTADPIQSPQPSGDRVRIGSAVLNFDRTIGGMVHADERFAMCSTFKFLAVAAVLHRVDRGQDELDHFIKYGERDILEWAPITKQHLREGGMTLEALCFAAIAYSDNTAGNLLLQTLGGPAGETAYARSLGDKFTRLDRVEPELNDVTPGEERDTTTPMAMLHDMQKILLGDALSVTSRKKLTSWMVQNTTGDAMIRAGVPRGWQVGDKTGRNRAGNTNDIGIVWRPDGRAILLSIYTFVPDLPAESRARTLADVARALVLQ